MPGVSVLVDGLLLLILALASFVALRPKLQADKPGILAGLALIGALTLSEDGLVTPLGLAHLPLLLVSLALIPGLALARCFGRIDMIALAFHRDFGLKGATLSGVKNEIATAVLVALLIGVAGSALGGRNGPALLAFIALLALGINPIVQLLALRLWHGRTVSVLTDRLVAPTGLSRPAPDPDIVLLYLEGTDRRFADRAVFGTIYDGLAAYATEGISLTRIGQIAGTGWSLAGMVASQSGLPVPPRGLQFQTVADRMTHFMPGQRFLGDILADRGYQSQYVVGGDTGFGGIGAMYRSHRIGRMTGFEEQRPLYPPEEFAAAQVDWFLDDQMVLDTASRLHAEALSDPAPLALIVETIGPHGPNGYLSRRHGGSGRAETTRDIGRAVDCLIADVTAFLDGVRLRQAARERPLRVVILSDHLNHVARLPPGGPDYAGFNTAILWGDPDAKGRVIDRPGSMIDLFPTMLDWLGWCESPVAAGLGRSLLSGVPTLVEEFGIPAIDRMIAGDVAFANLVWDRPACLAETPVTA